MATLTLAALRRLVALHRRGVDGAGAQLDTLVVHHSDELAALLGRDLDVEVLHDCPDRVELLANCVENTRQRNVEQRAQLVRERAEQLARQLAETARYAEGLLHVDPVTLDALMACSSFDYLVPDPGFASGIDRRRLRAFLRECRSAEVVHAELEPDRLRLRYRTAFGRGRVVLLHQAVPKQRSVLYLPSPPVHMQAAEPKAAVVEPAVSSAPHPTSSAPRPDREQPRGARGRERSRPWLLQVLDRFAETIP